MAQSMAFSYHLNGLKKVNLLVLLILVPLLLSAQTIYVSPHGNDAGDGSKRKPVATFVRAQKLAREFNSDTNVEVIFMDGIYYLPSTVTFGYEDSKDYPSTVCYRAMNEGKAIISGGKKLTLKWIKQNNGIYAANVNEDEIDQLYINGIRQRMARFPNAVTGENRNVYDTWILQHKTKAKEAEDPLNVERIAKWKNPEGAYLHAMHHSLWGDMHWMITGKNADGTLAMIGGWQNNRPAAMHPLYRIIENVKEELDSPGEWYYDKKENCLYYMPAPDVDINRARVEIIRLKHLIELKGDKHSPVRGINLKGLIFRHTSRTFMENKEPLLRSDWTIYRGGAVIFNGTENCTVENCEFDQVGGNTILVSNYNRRLTMKGCYIHHSGANGIAFVGNPSTVRSPLFRYGPQDYTKMDRQSGAKGDDFPEDCTVEDCLITMTGRDEKQTAPIQISMSYRIKVSHCSIYDVPRAGINISEGTFGGHVIQYCDVFNTVLETGDHGSFNSWGRDRYWTPDVAVLSNQVIKNPEMLYWDMLEPNILRNNRWRCDHGWDIDLDDGSSFYHIYNNLLLAGGLKLREGYNRIVTNNIIIHNSLHPHVWPENSQDIFCHNIVSEAYHPVAMTRAMKADAKWGEELDYNLFTSGEADARKFVANGADTHSLTGNPIFMDAAKGDFRVKESSPALLIDFRNFDMTQFGVMSKKLKAIAKTPLIPAVRIKLADGKEQQTVCLWMGSLLKISKNDDLSAYGVSFDQGGIAFDSVLPDGEAARHGFRTGDLIQSINGVRIITFEDLQQYLTQKMKPHEKQTLLLIRNQKEITIETTGFPAEIEIK